jgi:multicomponent Na+:H+ antiporter subunit E
MQHSLILLLAGIVIFEARPATVPFLLLAVAAAMLAHTRLPSRSRTPLHPLPLAAFIPWFLKHSVLGGVDVALRAFRGPRALSPGIIGFTTRIDHPVARAIFANTVSLMPGTLTARLAGSRLVVHTLDDREDVTAQLALVEERVARAFGELHP